MEIPATTIETLKQMLQKHSSSILLPTIFTKERLIIKKIQQRTKQFNQNNITRTKAYLNFYKDHPEVHWAFLAHLVSRNGGWNMTDLKGNLLSNLLSKKQQNDFFMFLETANALIFHDAYPQLLLYEESKRQNKSLFHLLHHFNISSFMYPVWELFFNEKNSQFLTIALIINEQHYIEKRVVQNRYFQETVLHSFLFQAQDLLQFTQVQLPYFYQNQKVRLAGVAVQNFSSINERINIGKRLYSILYGVEPLFKDILKFALTTNHTGSRNDYWNHIFSLKNSPKMPLSTKNISNSKEPFIYSPPLVDVWDNVPHSFSDLSDWYKGPNVLNYFSTIRTPKEFDITHTYCLKLQKTLFASSIL
ncbi:hypothetical protein BTR23_19855 [Alkalihalophilus pseudofirmus]|nr:hypothetical protein BTR23_19855 [Alkalihalophilus pseudofirmus]